MIKELIQFLNIINLIAQISTSVCRALRSQLLAKYWSFHIFKTFNSGVLHVSKESINYHMIEQNQSPNTQKVQRSKQMICHSQIASNNPNNMIYSMYDYEGMELFWNKIMLLSLNQYLFLMALCLIRADIFKVIGNVKKSNHQLTSQYFSTKLLFEKQEEVIQNKVHFRVKTPFFRGKNLYECIRQNNLSLEKDVNQVNQVSQQQKSSEKFSFIKLLIVNLLNLFMRLDKQALIIPTFRTILFDPVSKEFNINLFSFVGVGFLKHDELMQESELKQILPFLSCNMLKDEKNQINLPKALAVLVLGVFLGKEVNLLTSKDSIPNNKDQLKSLVKKNSQKFKKILKSQRLKQQIAAFQKQQNIRLSSLFQNALVNEKQLSWAQLKVQLSSRLIAVTEPNKNQSIQQKRLRQKIEQYVVCYAKYKWNQMSKCQKQVYIQNRILTLELPVQLTRLQDSEIFLVVLLEIDYTLMKNCFSLSQFLVEMQKKDNRSFNSNTIHLLDSFRKKIFEAGRKQQMIEGPDGSFKIQSAPIFIYQYEQQQTSQMSQFEFSSSFLSTATADDASQYERQNNQQQQIQQPAKNKTQREYYSEVENETGYTNKDHQKLNNSQTETENFQKNSRPDHHGNSVDLVDGIIYEYRPKQTKQNWFINNFNTIYVEPQIHKFDKTIKDETKQCKIQSSRLKTWRLYQKCMIE